MYVPSTAKYILPPKVFTCQFRRYTYTSLAVANLLAHNNLWLCYYGQVNSSVKI